MSASWAAVAVAAAALIFGALGAVIGFLLRSARREGKLDALLKQIVETLSDHERRLRLRRM